MRYVVVVDDEHMVEEFLEVLLRRADYKKNLSMTQERPSILLRSSATTYASSLQILPCLT